MDGTLLDDACSIPEGHVRAVRELRGLGVEVAIVTGRALLTTTWAWRALGLSTPLACFNGAWVGTPGSAPFAHAQLPEADVRAGIEELRGFDGAICAYPDAETWLIDRVHPRTAGWSELYRAPIAVAPERFTRWEGPSCKLMFVCAPEAMALLAPRLHARLGGRYHVVVSQEDRVEILPHGVTKAWGLERLAAKLGVPRERVWAVGDADNDLEMVAWAGHGCAMGHAPDSLRRIARHVLPSIHARGLCALPALVARTLG